MQKSWVKKGLVFGILLLFVTASAVSALNANPSSNPISVKLGNWLYVGGSGPGNYTKIQDAIDDSSDGDTVFIYDDSSPYNELITIYKSIRLIGEDKNTTLIDFNPYYQIYDLPIITVNADHCLIENLQITLSNRSNIVHGITINSSNNIIKNTIITDVIEGIELSTYSESNVITDNQIINNLIGVVAISSIKNDIYHNVFSNNTQYNIYLSSASDSNNVSFNTIDTAMYGVRIKGSQYNNLFKNNIQNNQIGLYFCCGAQSNYVYNNNLLKNSKHAEENAGQINFWYDYPNGTGNYWDDYNGSDENDDGIGDTPYTIPNAGNQDIRPLMTSYGFATLAINVIFSPFKVSFSIKNVGSITALNVHLLCRIDGGFFFFAREYSNITKSLLPEQEAILSTGFFGFGDIQITLFAWADNAPMATKKIEGKLLLFFFFQ